jgi:hypothetical protein
MSFHSRLLASAAAASLLVSNPADLTLDFGANAFTHAFSSQVNFSRASIKTDLLPSSPMGYAYKTFAVNQLARTPGRGDLIEADGTNLVANPTAPASQTVNLATAGVYVLWVNGPGSVALAANTAVLSAATPQIGGPGSASQGNPVRIKVLTGGTVDLAVTGALYAMQLELVAAPYGGTSFMPTGSRSADRYPIVASSAAYNLLASAQCTVCVEYEATDGTPNFGTVFRVGSQGIAYYFSPGLVFSNRDNGGTAITAALGEGTNRKAKTAIAWSASGRSFCGNGGTVNSDGNTMKAVSLNNYMIGHIDSTTGSCINGYIKRVDIYANRLSNSQLRTLTGKASFSRVFIADSLGARNDGQSPSTDKSIAQWLDYELGGSAGITLNGGVEGNTSTGAATRYLASPELWGLPLIIRIGNNNIPATSTILADIASMVAANTSGKLLILPPLNGQAANFQSGGSLYVNLTTLWSSLVSAYPNNTYDDRAALVAAYNAADPLDIVNHTEDRVPGSLRLISNIGNLPGNIDNAVTSFTLGAGSGADAIIKIGSEYIRVTTSSGNNITACVRGYGTGGVAASHNKDDVFYVIDNLHLGDYCRHLDAQLIEAWTNAHW